jgi:hypothetical protein
MSQFKRPMGALFKQLTYDNYYLKSQNNDLRQFINRLEANIDGLNRFIMTQYDLSFAVIENLRIVTFDGSGSVIACIHSDASGNFVPCGEMSGGYLPCVLPPILQPMMVSSEKVAKTHIYDTSGCDSIRDFPYDYPYYGYRYPYHGYRYPYYGYRYPYLHLYDDDYFYRDMDMSGVKFPNKQPYMKPAQPPIHSSLINGPTGTNIHIHTK